MTQPLLQIHKAIQWELVAFFWPIWAMSTVTAAICAAWAVTACGKPDQPSARDGRPMNSSRRPLWTWDAVTAVTILAVMLLGYGVVTFMWEDFADWDQSYFYAFHAKGHRWRLMISRRGGRFGARLPRIQFDTPFH